MTMLGMRCLLASSCSEPGLCVIEQGNVTQSLYVQWFVTSSHIALENEISPVRPRVLTCSVTSIETVLDFSGVSWSGFGVSERETK